MQSHFYYFRQHFTLWSTSCLYFNMVILHSFLCECKYMFAFWGWLRECTMIQMCRVIAQTDCKQIMIYDMICIYVYMCTLSLKFSRVHSKRSLLPRCLCVRVTPACITCSLRAPYSSPRNLGFVDVSLKLLPLLQTTNLDGRFEGMPWLILHFKTFQPLPCGLCLTHPIIHHLLSPSSVLCHPVPG